MRLTKLGAYMLLIWGCNLVPEKVRRIIDNRSAKQLVRVDETSKECRFGGDGIKEGKNKRGMEEGKERALERDGMNRPSIVHQELAYRNVRSEYHKGRDRIASSGK